ncbi:MAG: TonB-dependent receptor [Verrucomicrobia bacterium]|nr:TonB-dependent receptor [Prolixibacteraceae bacterium]
MEPSLLQWEKHRSIKGSFPPRFSFFLLFFLSVCSSTLFAQQRITGKVTAKDTAVGGATVQVKGNATTTLTDEGGNFAISVPTNATLLISSIGYETQEVRVGNRSAINIQLQSSSVQMGEVVVVGYGTQRKANLTGAVATVSGQELNKRVVTNPASLLQGKVAGIQIIEGSGEPGNEAINIRIRGMGSFGNTPPLVIIDGIPGNLSVLNPNDIASISVLKDAASSALYGNRAANGVILVTTKKGVSGKLTMEYSYNLGITSATRLLDLVTNSVEYMEMFNKARLRNGAGREYPQSFIDLYRNPTDPAKYPNIDWQDLLLNTVSTHNHYLSVNGGSGSTNFNVGIGYIDQPGVMAGFEFKKFTLQFGLNTVVNKNIEFGLTTNLNYGNRRYPRQGASEQYLAAITQAPMYGPEVIGSPGNFVQNNSDPYNGHNKNPFAVAKHVRAHDQPYNILANLYLRIKPLQGLVWETRGGVNYFSQKTNDFRPIIPMYNWYTGAYAGNLDVGLAGLNIIDNNTINPVVYSQLTYNKEIGNHSFTLLGGVQSEFFKSQQLRGDRRGFLDNTIRELNAGGLDGQTTAGTSSEWAMQSVYGRLNYSFNNKYLFEANFRKDGSSRFSEGNRWATFPSVSAGWRISQEGFMKDIDWLSELKLRGSVGRLGNQDNVSNYPYQDNLNVSSIYPIDNTGVTINGAIRPALVDKNIQWETVDMTNIGADIALFKNKLNITAEWFKKKTSDILRGAQIQGYLGVTAPTVNHGVLNNTGFELNVQYNNNIGDLRYGIGGILQKVKNEIVRWGNTQINNTTINKDGMEFQAFWLWDWIGIFQDQEEINKSATHPAGTKPGDLKFRDVNNDGVINVNDRIYFEGAYPSFNYSFNLNLAYKNFDLTAFLYGVEGQKQYVQRWGLEPFTQGTAPTKDWRDAWTPQNKSNTLPALYVWNNGGPITSSPSTFFLRDGSFLRIKNIQVGYNVPAALTKKIGISEARFYFSGDNLFVFTNYPGLDPERTPGVGQNTSFQNYPQNRILSFGARIKF